MVCALLTIGRSAIIGRERSFYPSPFHVLIAQHGRKLQWQDRLAFSVNIAL